MDYKADVREILGREDLVQPLNPDPEHPSTYRADPGLVGAVNVALTLERPLLLTGDPGTGKTQLAYSLAWQLAAQKALNVTSPRVLRFETKSTSVSRDLFYSFDVVARFHAAQTQGNVASLNYVTYNALGCAILDGFPKDAVKQYLPAAYRHDGPRRSVVLIDEVDKAPRDFPNDLLSEIDQMYFRIPELQNVQIGGDTHGLRPIVIITSNSEKSLPDPFLRRCIYYNIPPPTPERLEEIVLARLRLTREGGELVQGALGFFVHLRENSVTHRKVSVAELLQWVTYLLRAGAAPEESLRVNKARAMSGVPALSKDPDDQDRVTRELEAFLERP